MQHTFAGWNIHHMAYLALSNIKMLCNQKISFTLNKPEIVALSPLLILKPKSHTVLVFSCIVDSDRRVSNCNCRRLCLFLFFVAQGGVWHKMAATPPSPPGTFSNVNYLRDLNWPAHASQIWLKKYGYNIFIWFQKNSCIQLPKIWVKKIWTYAKYT